MTAAEYAALAKRAAAEAFADNPYCTMNEYVTGRYGSEPMLFVFTESLPGCILVQSGNHHHLGYRRPADCVMQCALTPESTASEAALVRALLASAVSVKQSEVDPAFVSAKLGDDGRADFGRTEAAARNALLAALLSDSRDVAETR